MNWASGRCFNNCVKNSARLIKFSSFRPGGATDETDYGVLHIDNASSDGDVRYSSDNVMIIFLKLKKERKL
jgi:hypothetical protein